MAPLSSKECGMCDPAQELDNATKAPEKFVNSLSSGAQNVISSANKVIDNVIRNPLPVIETVALTWALGPEGLALGLEETTAAAIANAAVTAANGGKIENIAIAAATSYVSAQVGQAAGNAANAIEAKTLEQLGPQYADQALIKQIVTSSSGTAAATALRGGSFKQVLASGLTGSVDSYIADSLKAQGFNNVDTKLLANATSSATRAILNGTDVSTAIGQSIASTTLSATISGKVDQINKNNEMGKSLADQFDSLKTAASDYYTKTLVPLQDKAQGIYDSLTTAKTNYDTVYAKYTDSYNSYVKNKNYYENGFDPNVLPKGTTKDTLLAAANADADAVNAVAPKVKDAAAAYKTLADSYDALKPTVLDAQNTYNTNYVAKLTDINNKIVDLNTTQTTLAKGVGEDVVKYQEQVKNDATGLAQNIAKDAVDQTKTATIQNILTKYGVNPTDTNVVDTLKTGVTEQGVEQSAANYAEAKRSQDPLYYDAVKRAYDYAISQGKSPAEASAFATAYGNSDYGARLLHTSDTTGQTEQPTFKVDVSGYALTSDADPEKVKQFVAPAGTKLAYTKEIDDPNLNAFYDPTTDSWLVPEKPILEGVDPNAPVNLSELKNYVDDSVDTVYQIKTARYTGLMQQENTSGYMTRMVT